MTAKHLRNLSFLYLAIFLSACANPNVNTNNSGNQNGVRTLGTMYDDQYIESTASKKIRLALQETEGTRHSLISVNGIVLLVGQVPFSDMRNLAAQLVQDTVNVRQVHNNMTIEPKISLLTQTQDSLITSQVKAIMIGNTKFPSTRVKVVTENSIVYLMGLVTRAEADMAVQLTRKASSIKKIVKIFEYID